MHSSCTYTPIPLVREEVMAVKTFQRGGTAGLLFIFLEFFFLLVSGIYLYPVLFQKEFRVI